MENEALQLNAHPLIAIAIMAAIPVVIFAIWADLFERFIQNAKKQKEEFDVPTELRRIRWASIVAFLAEGATYLMTTPLREKFYLSSLGIFCVALMIQSLIQSQTEAKLRKTPIQTAAQVKWLAKSTAWVIASIAVYFGWIWASFAIAYHVLEKSPFNGETRVALLFVAGIVGILTATLSLLAAAPIHLRNLIPNKEFGQTELRNRLENCFRKAGFEPPQLFIMSTEDFKYSNAIITGFPKAKGLFRPILMISDSLLKGLSDDELEAVVNHEVAHWSLHHLKRKIGAIAMAIVGTTLLFGSMLIFSAIAMPPSGQAMTRIITTLLSVVLPFWLVKSQTRFHEIEADFHAVAGLNTDFEVYASSLRKLDKMNDQDSGTTDPFSQLGISGGHPSTELRILRLRTYLEARKKVTEIRRNIEPPSSKAA